MSKRAHYAEPFGICPNKLVNLFRLTEAEAEAVEAAAKDAHMSPVEYCRLMVLCAAGVGGVVEHIERVIEASADADSSGALILSVGKER